MKKDTQSINANLEALSREKEEEKGPTMHESEDRYDEGHLSIHSVSSRSHKSEIHYRHKRPRKEPRREEIDGIKCKIPPFLGESKPNSYLDWEMKVEKIFECFDFNERMRIKLVTLEFSGYALDRCNQLRDLRLTFFPLVEKFFPNQSHHNSR
ncbi:hypothetical protein CR513_48746, partial [Mucuna pruriens]